MKMRKSQSGLSLSQLLMFGVVFGIAVSLAAKLLPEYIDFWKIRGDVKAIAKEVNSNPNATVADVRQAFSRRAEIDEIHEIKGSDLDVSKDGNQIVIGFSYESKVHLVANVSVLIEFEGSSDR